jgi:hypothetical protein
MPFTTLNLGLSLTIPTSGTTNWGPTLYNTTWTKISNHNHTGSGDGNKMVTASYTDYSVTKDKLAKNAGLFHYGTPSVPAGTTQTIDFVDGSTQVLDLGAATGDVTLTLSNPVAGVEYKLFVIQGATARDIIWPASVKWANGQKPILSQDNDAVDKVKLYFDGTNYYGDWDLSYS